MREDDKLKYSVLRFITPILLTISLFVLGRIYIDSDELKKDIVALKVDMAAIKANHCGR